MAPLIYCAICGAPMGDVTGIDKHDWLEDAVLLTTAHDTELGVELDEYWPTPHSWRQYSYSLGPSPPPEDQRTVLRVDALAMENYCKLLDSAKPVTPFCLDLEGWESRVERHDEEEISYSLPYQHGAPLYLPTHRACLQLADRFIDSIETSLHSAQVVPPDGITSVKQLWEVLYRRLHNDNGLGVQELPEPHNYFGGKQCRNVYWEGEDDPDGEVIYSDRFSEMMPNVLKTRSSTCKIRCRSQILPMQNLQPISTSDPQSASQDWYFESLSNGQLFPWLWDLDIKVMRELQQARRWDWERLARQMAQKRIHEPEDNSVQLPLPLRNRRRIWRLLEEARVGDIATIEEARMTAIALAEERQRELLRPRSVYVDPAFPHLPVTL